MLATLTIALFAFLAQERSAPAPPDLAAAKALYASGAYEEALTRLPSPADAGLAADEASQYRALCSLALGRTNEARASLEELITRRPLFRMSEAEVSPKLITMFHDARRRLLPNLVRSMYVTAKTSFDQKQYDTASGQLKDLLTLLGDEDLAPEAAVLTDLKMLAEGFQKLTNAELASAARSRPVEPAPAIAAPATPEVARIYSEVDKDVVGPVEIKRTFPPYRPSGPLADKIGHSGVLRVVIDEQGKVESAALSKSVTPAYDPLLLAAARDWQFRPATKDGKPVKYLKLIAVTLSPR